MKKKWLSLALAWALTLSAALPSPARAAEDTASAAGPYFKDQADITHPEAVEALVRLGVLWGKEDGSCFDPKGTVTRGEAAKCVALILNGGEDIAAPTDTSAAEPAFNDIQDHWAESWINYCAEKGAAFPRDGGSFDPNGLIGRYDMLRMVEAVLGYGNFGRGINLTGEDWIGNVHFLAKALGLFDHLEDVAPKTGRLDNDTPITRDEVAYILYGALNSAPYLGTETRAEGSAIYFDKKFVTRPDGTPSTLLRENFGYDSWADVPALPDRVKPGEQKPKAQRGIDPTTLSDAKDVQYWQAVASLARLGVVSGRDDGAFHPADGVTRAEAAKMISVIMNGGSEANTGVRKEPTFTDIQGHWAEGWIEYCADMGIVNGDGKGHFDPEGPVTVIQFYKMALTALGYSAVAYKLTGESWQAQTLELVRKTGGKKLTEGLPNDGLDGRGDDRPASREVAAQILYNALLATPMMVVPDGRTGDGEVVWEYKPSDPSDTLLRQRFDLKEMPTVPAQPTT